MSHITPEARARAGETRKSRTREKLVHAVDALFKEGRDPTVEKIAEEAGVSVPTFYNFYTSRNALCLDAVLILVVVPLEEIGLTDRPFADRVTAFVKQCNSRGTLIRAALLGRLEHEPHSKLIERVADVLTPQLQADAWSRDEAFIQAKPLAYWKLRMMIALELLDSIATFGGPDPVGWEKLLPLVLPATGA